MDARLKEKLDIESWCFRNNVLIYAEPVSNTQVRIVTNINGKPTKGKILYRTKLSNLKKNEANYMITIYNLRIHYYKL